MNLTIPTPKGLNKRPVISLLPEDSIQRRRFLRRFPFGIHKKVVRQLVVKYYPIGNILCTSYHCTRGTKLFLKKRKAEAWLGKSIEVSPFVDQEVVSVTVDVVSLTLCEKCGFQHQLKPTKITLELPLAKLESIDDFQMTKPEWSIPCPHCLNPTKGILKTAWSML